MLKLLRVSCYVLRVTGSGLCCSDAVMQFEARSDSRLTISNLNFLIFDNFLTFKSFKTIYLNRPGNICQCIF